MVGSAQLSFHPLPILSVRVNLIFFILKDPNICIYFVDGLELFEDETNNGITL